MDHFELRGFLKKVKQKEKEQTFDYPVLLFYSLI